MTTQNLEPLIVSHPFFEWLSARHAEFLVGCAANRRYEDGEYLFKQGGEATEFFVVRHGKVSLEISDPQKGSIVLQTADDSDVVGWSWIVPPYKNRFDARAIGLTRVLVFDAKCLRDKFVEDHELGYEMLRRFVRVMAERIEASRLQLLDMYGHQNND